MTNSDHNDSPGYGSHSDFDGMGAIRDAFARKQDRSNVRKAADCVWGQLDEIGLLEDRSKFEADLADMEEAVRTGRPFSPEDREWARDMLDANSRCNPDFYDDDSLKPYVKRVQKALQRIAA